MEIGSHAYISVNEEQNLALPGFSADVPRIGRPSAGVG